VTGSGLTVNEVKGYIADGNVEYTGSYFLYDSDGYLLVQGKTGFGPPPVYFYGPIKLPNGDNICNLGSNDQTACEKVEGG
jgi:hypothetical protein